MVHLHLHTHFSFGIGVSSPEVLAAAAAQRGTARSPAPTPTGSTEPSSSSAPAMPPASAPSSAPISSPMDEETVALAMDERGWGALCRAITADSLAATARAAQRWPRGAIAPVRQPRHRSRRSHPPLPRHRLPRARRPPQRAARTSTPSCVPARSATPCWPRRAGWGSRPSPPTPWSWRIRRTGSLHRLLRAIALNTTLSALDDAVRRSERPAVLRARCLALPDRRAGAPLPRLPRGDRARRRRSRSAAATGSRSAATVPPRFADAGDALRAAPALRLRGRAAALRHHRPGDPGPAGARARHHRAEGLRRLFPGGARHRRARADPLRPGLGRQLDRELLSRHHPRGAARRGARCSSAFSIPSGRIRPTSTSIFPGTSATRCWPTSSGAIPGPAPRWWPITTRFKLRGALREVAKVHGRPAGEIREVTRRIPWYYATDEPLDELLAAHPNFTRARSAGRAGASSPGLAEPLVGMPRHLSLHPGGVVIVPGRAHRLRPDRARGQDARRRIPISRCRSSSSRRTAPRTPGW